MKRDCEGRTIAEVIRLNVGGRHFDTTRETLSMAGYFEPYLNERIGHAVDEQGRLFVDRNGELFGHLLHFMRTTICPPRQFVIENKKALLEECAFFCLEYMEQRIRGEISPYDLRLEDRKLKERADQAKSSPEDFPEMLVDVFQADTSPKDPCELLLPLLPLKSQRASVKGRFADFADRFNKITGGLLEHMTGIKGVVFAGGSVVGALTGTPVGDVDIFLTCAVDDAYNQLQKIFEAIQTNCKRLYTPEAPSAGKTRLLITRSKHAVTLFTVHDHRSSGVPVQVVLSVYPNTLALLISFDVDVCACAYVPETQKVICTPRALRALRYGVNIVDSEYDGPGFCRRLEKYESRGFAIAVPGFDPSLISSRIMNASYVHLLPKYDLLLRAEPQETLGRDLSVTLSEFDGMCVGTKEVDLKATSSQRCSFVKGFERMAVLKYCANVKETATARLVTTAKKCAAEHNAITGACVPMLLQSGTCTLLWDCGTSEEHDEEDDQEYSVTPLASVYELLEQSFDRKLEARNDNEFEWCFGGAMQKFSKMPVMAVIRAVRSHVAAHVHENTKLQYVYDLCHHDANFETLRFVLHAGRAPLQNLDEDSFEKTYGVSKRLMFKKAETRERVPSDWWSVYV